MIEGPWVSEYHDKLHRWTVTSRKNGKLVCYRRSEDETMRLGEVETTMKAIADLPELKRLLKLLLKKLENGEQLQRSNKLNTDIHK